MGTQRLSGNELPRRRSHEWLKMAHGSLFEMQDSLRRAQIIDPISGRVGGDAVLDLLRELAYGMQPSALVRPVLIR